MVCDFVIFAACSCGKVMLSVLSCLSVGLFTGGAGPRMTITHYAIGEPPETCSNLINWHPPHHMGNPTSTTWTHGNPLPHGPVQICSLTLCLPSSHTSIRKWSVKSLTEGFHVTSRVLFHNNLSMNWILWKNDYQCNFGKDSKARNQYFFLSN